MTNKIGNGGDGHRLYVTCYIQSVSVRNSHPRSVTVHFTSARCKIIQYFSLASFTFVVFFTSKPILSLRGKPASAAA